MSRFARCRAERPAWAAKDRESEQAKSSMAGVDSVTISVRGAGETKATSVTMTGEQFARLGENLETFEAAKAHVRKVGRASISNLQRALNIGYNRAAGLIEILEHQGIVSPPDSSGHRKVL